MSGAYYWSNGTEGEMWLQEWCYCCEHDHAFSHGKDWGDGADGCEVYLRAMVAQETSGDPIPEFIDREAPYFTPSCVMFRLCPKCHPDEGDGRPKPPPPDPNQGLLFEVPEHVLMYRDVLIDAGLIETPVTIGGTR